MSLYHILIMFYNKILITVCTHREKLAHVNSLLYLVRVWRPVCLEEVKKYIHLSVTSPGDAHRLILRQTVKEYMLYMDL
jgi:hypothetical protein